MEGPPNVESRLGVPGSVYRVFGRRSGRRTLLEWKREGRTQYDPFSLRGRTGRGVGTDPKSTVGPVWSFDPTPLQPEIKFLKIRNVTHSILFHLQTTQTLLSLSAGTSRSRTPGLWFRLRGLFPPHTLFQVYRVLSDSLRRLGSLDERWPLRYQRSSLMRHRRLRTNVSPRNPSRPTQGYGGRVREEEKSSQDRRKTRHPVTVP